jgi:hypothetical protein
VTIKNRQIQCGRNTRRKFVKVRSEFLFVSLRLVNTTASFFSQSSMMSDQEKQDSSEVLFDWSASLTQEIINFIRLTPFMFFSCFHC